jgi:osmotically-inducible protein OsmY
MTGKTLTDAPKRKPRRARAGVFPVIAVLGLAAALVAGLSGCGVVVGAGAATGITAYQERGVEGAAEDLRIEIRILDKWLNHDGSMVRKLGIDVYESRVLLTGIAAGEKMRADAVRLTWRAAGVKEVLNEIQLPGEGGETSLARDGWITAQLKSKITFDQKIYAVNYFIETVNGVVYLIGTAQNQAELDRVTAHAKQLAYVNKVVSHVLLKKPKGS